MLQKIAYIYRDKCVECEACIEVCPVEAILKEEPYGIVIETDQCSGCGKCVTSCTHEALRLV